MDTVTDADVPACAAVLAEAFFDDPVHSFIWPDPQRRARALPRFFDLSMRYAHPLDAATQIRRDGAVAGVAVWDRPGWRQPLASRIRSAPALLATLRTRTRPALTLIGAMEQSYPNAPHWHLNNLATTPGWRGTGIGNELVQRRLDECDRARTDAYLVCTRESTIDYYEHFGFRVTEAIRVPGGPTLWGMSRRPA